MDRTAVEENALNAGASEAEEHSFTTSRRWGAALDLSFDAPAGAAGRTRLRGMRFHGPLRVQRPFYPEGSISPESALDAAAEAAQSASSAKASAENTAQNPAVEVTAQPIAAGIAREKSCECSLSATVAARAAAVLPPMAEPCHCYILHPPGGMVSGDALNITMRVERGGHALVTTPSAGKIYAADGCGVPQRQQVRGTVAGGVLEWLPQETIVFDHARGELDTHFSLDANSALLGWDITCLGRPAAGEGFTQGLLTQSLCIEREGRPLLWERLRLEAGSPVQRAACGLRGQPVFMTFFAVSRAREHGCLDEGRQRVLTALAAWRAAHPQDGDAAVTVRQGVLLTRFLGAETAAARQVAEVVWRALRPLLTGRAACAPRIWNT